MKSIGLLGGLSWESTKTYYEILNIEVKNRLGGLNSARVILNSVNFSPLEEYMRQSDWEKIAGLLANEAASIEKGGGDCLLLCSNTMHKVFDEIEGVVGIPFFHIADTLGAKLAEQGIKKIGLLGTRFTMTEAFYSKRLSDHFGIETLIPETDEATMIDRVIFDELCVGKIREESKRDYIGVMHGLMDRGADAIAFACTEIELMIKPQDVDMPVFDATQLHAEHAVNWALEEE